MRFLQLTMSALELIERRIASENVGLRGFIQPRLFVALVTELRPVGAKIAADGEKL